MGWDVNVHVNLQKQLMLRSRGLGQYIYIYTDVYIFENIYRILSISMYIHPISIHRYIFELTYVYDDDDDDEDDPNETCQFRDEMKLVNSATKFRHGIYQFYQPNSGLRGSKTWDEACLRKSEFRSRCYKRTTAVQVFRNLAKAQAPLPL